MTIAYETYGSLAPDPELKLVAVVVWVDPGSCDVVVDDMVIVVVLGLPKRVVLDVVVVTIVLVIG